MNAIFFLLCLKSSAFAFSRLQPFAAASPCTFKQIDTEGEPTDPARCSEKKWHYADSSSSKMQQHEEGNRNILFVHGLESGPNGRKAQYLRRKFRKVVVPDLGTGLFSFARNSFLLGAMRSLGHIFSGEYVKQAWATVLESSIQTVLDDTQQQLPDIAIGSSLGGATLLEAIRLGHLREVPLLLFAPAFKQVWLGTGNWYQEVRMAIRRNQQPILIVCGSNDTIVPLADIEEFCGTVNCPNLITLKVVEGGDHSLNAFLLDGPNQRNMMCELIDSLMSSQQQAIGGTATVEEHEVS